MMMMMMMTMMGMMIMMKMMMTQNKQGMHIYILTCSLIYKALGVIMNSHASRDGTDCNLFRMSVTCCIYWPATN